MSRAPRAIIRFMPVFIIRRSLQSVVALFVMSLPVFTRARCRHAHSGESLA